MRENWLQNLVRGRKHKNLLESALEFTESLMCVDYAQSFREAKLLQPERTERENQG